MDTVTGDFGELYNSPLEAGIRAVVILEHHLRPQKVDLAEMVLLDHVVVHTADMGGPPSLHPDLPGRKGELLVRRRAERSDLAKATASLAAEQEALERRAERLEVAIAAIEGAILKERPLEASSRAEYEQLLSVRDKVRRGIRLVERLDDLRRQKAQLSAFRPATVERGSVSVGVSGVVGFQPDYRRSFASLGFFRTFGHLVRRGNPRHFNQRQG